MKITIITLVLNLFTYVTARQARNLTVDISGLRSDKGKCIIYLYNGAAGYPTKPSKAIRTFIAGITGGTSIGILTAIPPGTYAIAVVHDENSNGKMDTNFIGIPKEGIGTSNNRKSSFGPPGFDDSSFHLSGTEQKINIIIKYL